jgi:hypothetical protein
MSVLRDRIIRQTAAPNGTQAGSPEYTHPYGTSATPMVMPLAVVDYDSETGTGWYQDLHAVPATADPNHVPMAGEAPGSFGQVVPAGKPG